MAGIEGMHDEIEYFLSLLPNSASAVVSREGRVLAETREGGQSLNCSCGPTS